MNQLLLQVRRLATLEAVTSRTARRAVAVVFFALLTALSAYGEVRLPLTPVPITFQTLIVSLSGVLLGAHLGAASQALYLLAGAMGAPVFSGGAAGFVHLMGPTGGYLLAFPLAAAVTGWLAARVPEDRTFLDAVKLAEAIFLGTLVIFAGGAAQLALLTGDLDRAIRLGVLPFLVGDVIKVAVALLIARRIRRKTLALF
jgi:biotin transport system substrate-specific component